MLKVYEDYLVIWALGILVTTTACCATANSDTVVLALGQLNLNNIGRDATTYAILDDALHAAYAHATRDANVSNLRYGVQLRMSIDQEVAEEGEVMDARLLNEVMASIQNALVWLLGDYTSGPKGVQVQLRYSPHSWSGGVRSGRSLFEKTGNGDGSTTTAEFVANILPDDSSLTTAMEIIKTLPVFDDTISNALDFVINNETLSSGTVDFLKKEPVKVIKTDLIAGRKVEQGSGLTNYEPRQADGPAPPPSPAGPVDDPIVPMDQLLSILQRFGIVMGNTTVEATNANNTATTLTANTTAGSTIEVPGGLPMTFGQAQSDCIIGCQSSNTIRVNATYVYKSNNNNTASVGNITNSQNEKKVNSGNVADSNNNNDRSTSTMGFQDSVMGNITTGTGGSGGGGRGGKGGKGVGGGMSVTPAPPDVVSTSNGTGTGVLAAAVTNSKSGDVNLGG